MQRDERGAGRAAELLAQQHPDVLVDAQRLVDVAARPQDLHQRGAAGLPERLRLHGRAGGLLGLGVLGAAELGPGRGQRLERLDAQVGELGAPRVDPGRLQARQQPAFGDLERGLRGFPRLTRVGRLARAAKLSGRDLEVDPRVVGQHQLQLRAALQHAGTERLAQPGQRGREQRLVSGRGALAAPQCLGELVAAHRPVAVQGQIGEEQATLTSAQGVFEPPSRKLHDESPAYLYAGRVTLDHAGESIHSTVRLSRFWKVLD